MLSAKEAIQLKKLQDKASNHTPLTDQDLEAIDGRVTALYDGLPLTMKSLAEMWNGFIGTLTPLADDNARLIQEVRYLQQRNTVDSQ